MRLNVDRIEAGNEVEGGHALEGAHVLRLEPDVAKLFLVRFRPPGGEAFLREVIANEPALREGFRHQVDRVPAAAADVSHIDARLEPCGQPLDEWHGRLKEPRVECLRAVLSHEPLKVSEFGIRDAAAPPK